MMMNKLRAEFNKLRGQEKQLKNDLDRVKDNSLNKKRELKKYEQAKEVVKKVSLDTQKQLQYHIGDVTSLALESVFENPYELQLNFIERRGKTECDICFVRDGIKVDPISASGGGAVDVAAFALRMASWALEIPKSRNTIILDEPMKNVSEDYKDQVSYMIKDISKKLGIQFIIVTHEPKLTAYADKVFEVLQCKKISQIKTPG